MKSYLILTALLVCTEIASAQTKEKSFQKHYVNHTEVGVLLGRNAFDYGGYQAVSQTKVSFSAQMYNGIQLNRVLSTGISAGMDWYKTALITPLTAGARWDLMKDRNARLFASADVGYGFAWLHQDADGYRTKGGLSIHPGIGIKYGNPVGNQFTIALGYKRQYVHVDKPRWEADMVRKEERIYNRLALKIGMAF
jgi:hypothetical protein